MQVVQQQAYECTTMYKTASTVVFLIALKDKEENKTIFLLL